MRKPTPGGGGSKLFRTSEDDAAERARIKVKLDEQYNDWQVGQEVQQHVR